MIEPLAFSNPDTTWLKRLLKVELHIHLEGAIPHEALWALVETEARKDRKRRSMELFSAAAVYNRGMHFI